MEEGILGEGRFHGRVAVVTGGASGIGEAIVRLVVAEGGSAVIADLQDDLGEALEVELGGRTAFAHADVAHEHDVAAAVTCAMDRFGGLDVVCNNAGMPGPDPSIVDVEVAQYRRVLDVLVLGVVLGTKHGARAMIAGGHGGAIVNITSTSGLRGGEGPHLYTTAKHAVIGLTRSCASELGQHGIRVNAVAPGGIPTPMAAAFKYGDATRVADVAASIAERSPVGRGSTPADVAEAVAYLASDASGYVTGHTLAVDAGKIAAPPRTPAG
jgi:NAD(P)-dependent dehydrogenase (short-subunit alcohol dehydrogenase family)